MSAPQFFDHTDLYGTRRIAMLAQPGAGPAIIWLGGFCSDMRATKAEALASFAAERSQACLRFDYSGHGESAGDFADGTISQWLGDSIAAISAHGGTAPILVGSSMGGWLALLAAKALRAAQSPSAPSALVLIAPAVDFTEALMWAAFAQDIRDQIMRDGMWMRPSAYAPQPTPITRALIEDGRKHLMFGATIDPGCPVTILQGMMDQDVPWQQAMRLVEHLPQSDVTLTLIKNGDHRLSGDEDIARLKLAVAGALGKIIMSELSL